MNHIKRLEADVDDLGLAIEAYDSAIGALTGYLQSNKFHEDTTVQVQDVLLRLTAVRYAPLPYIDRVHGRRPK